MRRTAALLFTLAALLLAAAANAAPLDTVRAFAAYGDRSTGTEGARLAAEHIAATFRALGFETDRQVVLLPRRLYGESRLDFDAQGASLDLMPLEANSVHPQATPPGGVSGPLVWTGGGSLAEMEGRPIAGAVVLMDIVSGKNWMNAASLGAVAVIFVDPGESPRGFFTDKRELTPLDLPTFIVSEAELASLAPGFRDAPSGIVSETARLTCHSEWHQVRAENIYAFVPGTSSALSEQLLVVEAFYDSEALVPGHSPGADEAASIAALLDVARRFKDTPPSRSVLLVATAGHAQGLAGVREFVSNVRAKGKRLMDLERDQQSRSETAKATLEVLEEIAAGRPMTALSPSESTLVAEALTVRIKDRIDQISTRLMRLRLEERDGDDALIRELASRRIRLRNLSETPDFTRLDPESLGMLREFVDEAIVNQQAVATDADGQLESIRSGRKARSLMVQHDVAAWVSLHLSTQGNGVGAFNYGFFYDIRPDRNRNPAYNIIERVLTQTADALATERGLDIFRDTLRPSRIRPWQTWFLARPGLGGEVAARGGVLGLTLATVEDARPYWGTPYDVPERVDEEALQNQTELVAGLVQGLADHPDRLFSSLPREGLAEVEGRARFIRQGELFPDQPAPGTIVQVSLASAMMFAMVDASGNYRFNGLCDRKNTYHNAVIEAYRFDPESGRVIWAADKTQTGRRTYRLRIVRQFMQADLIMFAASPITLFNLLEPRTFAYMTRINLFDGRRDAEPLKYWFSRIDSRDSTLASIFLENTTPLKMTLSDSVLTRKLILTGALGDDPEGDGYSPAEWTRILATEFRIASDMWALLAPRVANLETHGIVNERIRAMQDDGVAALKAAGLAFEEMRWSDFLEQSRASWALASRVYLDVEKTQRDVLLGVLFYIALFIPFAYCVERIVFAFADIHKRILGFLGVLGVTIWGIYMVHPAFKLTYAPLVVILAFFIVGLSALVSIIIFMRFEKEMEKLQRRSQHGQAAEVSHLKAFGAAFVIGVTNLRRRRVRTSLTVATLVILTFTIMSFTAVKSVRQTGAVHFSDTAAYRGIMMKNLGWTNLPPEAGAIVSNAFTGRAVVAPRVWLENEDRTTSEVVPVVRGRIRDEALGLIGLSALEPAVSGLDAVLVGGRWFAPGETRAVLLPDTLARRLGIDPANPGQAEVLLWGMPFAVIGCFDGQRLDQFTDLDGESPTPVVFPSESLADLTAMQTEDLDSEGLSSFQGRYQHIPGEQVVIVPANMAMALGGRLKSLALTPDAPEQSVKALAASLVDRFGLPLFTGDAGGTFVYSASDSIDYSGVPNIVIPVFIAVLIVLNTMISSVYERKREIGVYTSVGMAPTHVSYLFIAEAVAFAVISAVLGYLLAQAAAALLSGTPIWSGMTANYSSLAGVSAMLLVIGVTLLSVVYPAKVAADIAIPDVNRSWTMPEGKGNEIFITLPFLLKQPEQGCVGGFLLDYYQAHQDVTHGLFCTDDIACTFACPMLPVKEGETPVADEEADKCLNLRADVWLAPFDFGVKQTTELIFCPSEEQPGFLEIRIRIVRQTGEAGIWKRLNKNFLNDLRKQLLVWRSLGDEERTGYETMLTEFMNRQHAQG